MRLSKKMLVAALLALPAALLVAPAVNAAIGDQTILIDPATVCHWNDYLQEQDCSPPYTSPVTYGSTVVLKSDDGGQWIVDHESTDTVISTVIKTEDGSGAEQDIPLAVVDPMGTQVSVTVPQALAYAVSQASVSTGIDIVITAEDMRDIGYRVISIPVVLIRTPSAPAMVTARRTTSTSASVAWQPPADVAPYAWNPITKYILTRRSSAGSWSTSVSPSTRAFTFTQLASGASYTLSVQAVSQIGAGRTATVGVPGTSASMNAPSSTTVKRTGDGAATVFWSTPSVLGGKTITGYKVTRDGTDAFGGGAYSHVVSATTRSFTMHYLVEGRTYNLSVQPTYSGGAGPVAKGGVFVG